MNHQALNDFGKSIYHVGIINALIIREPDLAYTDLSFFAEKLIQSQGPYCQMLKQETSYLEYHKWAAIRLVPNRYVNFFSSRRIAGHFKGFGFFRKPKKGHDGFTIAFFHVIT